MICALIVTAFFFISSVPPTNEIGVTDPCQDRSLHDCDKVAECFSEQPGYFQCRCPKGFADVSPDRRFPGRKCKKVNDECQLGTHDCDSNAECEDTLEGYNCRCKHGWSDVSIDPNNAPGRTCRKADLCATVECAAEAECHETERGPICECISGYIDVSRQHGMAAGHVCRRVVNECVQGKHDCSSSATCIDTADSFTCRCRDGFRDESPDLADRPGRVCIRAFAPEPPECDVNDPMSCDARKKEVCLFTNGTYKCQCAAGYGRLPDGRCLVINECDDHPLNDCAENADCIDQAEGYTCRCRSGYADVSPPGAQGTICRARVNECAEPEKYHVDCDRNAVCIDTETDFTCRCRPGFADISNSFERLPGRKCVEAVNECLNSALNDCSENAICEDAKEGYICTCRPGYVDASQNVTHYPGRVCHKPKRVISQGDVSFAHDLNSCNPKNFKCGNNEICTDRKARGKFVCDCADNAFRFTDGTCRFYAACVGENDCDKNAVCANTFDTYKCQCRPGFIDISPDPVNKPGRVCKELVNECATGSHDCSPFAYCIDATDGYICVCKDGFVDTSSQYQFAPGRRCSNGKPVKFSVTASNECADRTLNTCDENADCIDTPDSYTCQCYAGFVDVSSSAKLPPGRVCTVQTTCPKQKTDLMFLIDGSGSIGSHVFKDEVLRFVKEFVELFDIGLDNTRVGLIQYSDQIRHEFDLGQYIDKTAVMNALHQVQYLTGLTRTGAAIQHMVLEGFSERRGARTRDDDVARVAIVITDGRSQDNVSEPALNARRSHVNMFAVGVTDHVLASELEAIAGSPSHWFYVDRFKDLDTRLRSLIQKAACPSSEPRPRPIGGCNPTAQTGCNRALNEYCVQLGNATRCICPEGFQRHPVTRRCGGDQCNPELPTSCPHPEVCAVTSFSNFLCVCPKGFARDQRSGVCLATEEKIGLKKTEQNEPAVLPSHDLDCHNGGVSCGANEECTHGSSNLYHCECTLGFERNLRTGECTAPGLCDPHAPNPCDVRKREKCLPHSSGRYHTCQCAPGEKRHPVTAICLHDECSSGEHDCDPSSHCIDTDDGYLCACRNGYLDQSDDPVNRPGRVCVAQRNECKDGTHRCSPNAICTDTAPSYVCRCKPGYIDFSPNPHSFGGIVCKEMINECANPSLNTCHKDAICIDTTDSYKCMCKNGYIDLDELRNPGRNCQKMAHNDRCESGKNDCDRNARCIQHSTDDYVCACPSGYRDKSPDPNKPGRVCIPLIPECDNPTLNDCDSPDRAICTDTDEGYLCRCRQGFLDISPNITSKPGRLCKPLEDECALKTDDCAQDGGICEDTPDSYTCRCAINYLDVSFDRRNRPGRKCKRLVNECQTGQNDCSSEAICTDTEDSYECACPTRYIDVSPDTARKPGRRCLLRINECKENRHDCSPNADCVDTAESYICKCRDDFVDESPDIASRPGRICRPELVDECRLGKHDCHPNAMCQDLPHGYTCHCKSEFIDQSPNRATLPGRVCVPRPTPPPDECRVDSSSSCKQSLNEVCRLINGQTKCACPINYSRDPATESCTVINECEFPQLNDCHPSADCIDQPTGYTCRCRDDFRDVSSNSEKPGRICQPFVNECQFPHLNDCHQNAVCIDKEEGYECKCNQGYMDRSPERPGRLCKKMVDECARANLNSCDKNAKCIDEEDGYRCECNEGFLDVSPSPTFRGRACRELINECSDPKLNDCDKTAKCTDTTDSYQCECPSNSKDISPNPSFPGRVCLVFENECLNGKHDCDPNAICHDNEQSFTCECAQGYTDRSPNRLKRPGRVCVQLVDECATGRHTCSAQAECRDLEEGYTCECKDGFVDRSPNLLTQPGRVCGTPETCPSNHECSSAAVCEPLGGNKYECTCIQGYIDQSPGGKKGLICVRNNACRDPRLNNCSRNAICYDEQKGYRCECARGYVDRSSDPEQSGRVCEPASPPTPPPRHPCQDPLLNDCHPAGTCRATGAQSYTCECLQGYVDRSPDVANKPGRICVLTEPICLDSNQNDCHPAAICSETDTDEKYSCRCRDGYIDQSPDTVSRPGRICVEQVNECLDRSLNDCDPLAVCEDLPEGYTCKCPVNTEDRSPNLSRPGRKCFKQVNECRNPSLNNCSRFADCIDRPDGYQCRCREGYHDENRGHPGTVCTYIINECESTNLNDCDRNAECIDMAGGYQCRCKEPYRDESPPSRPGRVCRYDECLNPKDNTCDEKHANCEDLDDGYTCHCRHGFYDNSPNPLEPGRICVEFQKEVQKTHVPQDSVTHIEGIPCGRNRACSLALNEVCVGGVECRCRPGEARANPDDRCQPVTLTPIAIRVLTRDSQPLVYSSEYGNSDSAPYVELTHLFVRDFGRAIAGTVYGSRYVTTDVNFITHPKTFNSSWPEGLLFNASVATTPGGPPVNVCELWQQLGASLQQTNGAIGGGPLRVAPDNNQLDPCRPARPVGEACGDTFCSTGLGEVCIAGSICGCPNNEKRASPNDICRPVEAWNIVLWVLRDGDNNLMYTDTYANPRNSITKEYVNRFEKGIGQCYPRTALSFSYVTNEVNDVIDPMSLNATWDKGILFNSTVYFRKGSVRIPSDVYYMLVRYIIDRNGYQVGDSGLYLNSHQPDPFRACWKNNCHPKGVCIDLGPNAYRCECGTGYRDLNPSDPGRRCLPNTGYNECERKEDNECSENARCIDQEHLYRCECLPSFTDNSPPNAIPGSICVLDYCSDVTFCPKNTTCKNQEQQGVCQCDPGFVDIRRSEKRTQLSDQETLCLKMRDVDECALGLTNCSGVAECIDKTIGYECRCPEGYIDGNPEEPGRVCGALLCDLCNSHGDCVHNSLTNNITCVCSDGWTGEFCDVAPSKASLILLVILAILFLLLTLCCLLYFCSKCICFKGHAAWYREPFTYRKGVWPWSTLEASSSSDSGADFSGMSAAGHEYYPDIGIPRAKLKSTGLCSAAGAGGGVTDECQQSVARLHDYLDDGMRIPRAHLDADDDAFDSSSRSSSEYTVREEVERRVITDVTKKETRKTMITADVHGTTAEFHVYPPIEVTSESHSSSHIGGRNGDMIFVEKDEQERGESVAEFSIGNTNHRDWSNNIHNAEYHTDRDLESMISGSSLAEDETYDKKTLVTRSHGFEPKPGGGTERYRTEVTTTTTSKGVTRH